MGGKSFPAVKNGFLRDLRLTRSSACTTVPLIPDADPKSAAYCWAAQQSPEHGSSYPRIIWCVFFFFNTPPTLAANVQCLVSGKTFWLRSGDASNPRGDHAPSGVWSSFRKLAALRPFFFFFVFSMHTLRKQGTGAVRPATFISSQFQRILQINLLDYQACFELCFSSSPPLFSSLP